jgi:hypothetical protein
MGSAPPLVVPVRGSPRDRNADRLWRYGLSDEDSGAPHIIGLIVAAAVCGLDAWIVIRARGAVEALIRGRRSDGIIAAVRGALARAWVPIGLTLVGGLMLFFVFGLSLDLLSYYHAVVSTLGVLLVLLVLERLTERGWHDSDAARASGPVGIHQLVARSFRRILRVVVLLVAAMTLVTIWVDAIDPSPAAAARAAGDGGGRNPVRRRSRLGTGPVGDRPQPPRRSGRAEIAGHRR